MIHQYFNSLRRGSGDRSELSYVWKVKYMHVGITDILASVACRLFCITITKYNNVLVSDKRFETINISQNIWTTTRYNCKIHIGNFSSGRCLGLIKISMTIYEEKSIFPQSA